MKTIDLVRSSLQMSHAVTMGLAVDMGDAALVPSTSQGGNHTLWTVGHLAVVEGSLRQVLLGEANPVAHWQRLFAAGTKPSGNAGDYPPFDQVLQTYRDLREKSLTLLDEIGEAGMGRAPKAPPPGFEQAMQTIGQTFLLIALHQMQHNGQISDARRVAGRKRVFHGPGEQPDVA